VPAPIPIKRLEKPLETLILQGFFAISAVAKRDFSGYNMSYFSPVLRDPEKYRSDTNFQVSQTRHSDARGASLVSPRRRKTRQRGIIKFSTTERKLERAFCEWNAGREASGPSPFPDGRQIVLERFVNGNTGS
jgi:hypothetical protein